MTGRPLIPRTTPSEKRCVRCATVKASRLFNASAKSPDGLMSWCRACANAYSRAWTGRRLTETNA